MEEFKSVEEQKYDRAAKRVKAVGGFYKHLIVYVLVNVFLMVINYVNLEPNEKFWSFGTFSTAFFWGFGLAFHALGVFGTNVFLSKDWEERKIKEIMDKQKSQKWE